VDDTQDAGVKRHPVIMAVCLFPLAGAFLATAFDNADPLFALAMITPCFHLHHVDVADQYPVSGSLQYK